MSGGGGRNTEATKGWAEADLARRQWKLKGGVNGGWVDGYVEVVQIGKKEKNWIPMGGLRPP